MKEFLEEAVAEIQDKGLVHSDLPLLAEHLPASHLLLAELGLPVRLLSVPRVASSLTLP